MPSVTTSSTWALLNIPTTDSWTVQNRGKHAIYLEQFASAPAADTAIDGFALLPGEDRQISKPTSEEWYYSSLAPSTLYIEKTR